MSTRSKPFITPEQYLEIERNAEYKSEYLNGEMFAMAGGSGPHNEIAVNITSQLHGQLRHRRCKVYDSDMQVQVSPTGLDTYPDACVVCGEARFLDERRQTLLNPTLIIEVLSPSTEAYNRGRKFEHYKTIESLAQYLLVSSDHKYIDLFTRQPDGDWLLTSASAPGDSLELSSIGCRLAVDDVYEQVEF
jgi:Uma2 family endonuclease